MSLVLSAFGFRALVEIMVLDFAATAGSAGLGDSGATRFVASQVERRGATRLAATRPMAAFPGAARHVERETRRRAA